MADQNLKEDIVRKARAWGAAIVKTCDVSCWERYPLQPPEFWPQNIWPWAKSVIVLAIPLLLPMAATAPSMVYQEQYDTGNRVMDDMAYRLASYLMTEKGQRAVYFPRDGYDGIAVLLKNPAAAFSHVVAGYYAGVGTIGASHNLLTKDFGPRIRLVSVITDAPLEPDAMPKAELCLHCGKCLRQCPAGCFTDTGAALYAMDKDACTAHHIALKEQHHWPCGYCATFCPVGEDLRLYRDGEIVTPAGVTHCQTFGS